MGTTQSTHATPEIKKEAPSFNEKDPSGKSVSGLKNSTDIVPAERCTISAKDEVFAISFGDSSLSSDESEEEDEEWNERVQILADAKQLKKLAVDYMHPEKPVEVDPLSACRNYFDRASAPEVEDAEDAQERAQILADAQQLKKLAVDYMHPEKPVFTSDPCATGRNYFNRASAAGLEEAKLAEMRVQILADTQQLKKFASDYLAPGPVEVDPLAKARCFFDRPSARGHEDHIHSQGVSLLQGQQVEAISTLDYHDHDATYYHGHNHDDHSFQSDHFEMDDEHAVFDDIRQSLQKAEPFKGNHPEEREEEEEGKLSRSPSCVMLFDESGPAM